MHSCVLSRERVRAGSPQIQVLGRLRRSTGSESETEKVSGGEEVANSSSVAPGWMSSSQLQLFSASLHPPSSPQDATGLTVGPETVVTGDQQTSEPVARLTYTYSGHKLMKCTHCWGLLANTCALVCAHTHNCTQRHTNKHTGSLSST